MANLLVTGLPFAFVAVARGRGLWARVIGLAGIAATLPAIALTGSRTGVISLAVVLVLLAVHLRRRLLLFVVLVPSVLTIVWIHTPADLQNRYATILRPSGQITFVNRIHSIDIAMRMWATSPLLGVGPGNFGVARHGLYEPDWHQAHNVAAQVGAELGLAGLAAFTCFIVVTFRALRRARRALGPQSSDPERVWGYWLAVAAEICLIALLVQGLASHNMYRFTYYFLAAVAVRLDLFAARLMATQSADTAQTVSRPSPL